MGEAVRPARSAATVAFWLVLLAAGGLYAVTMGARQSMGLFLNTLNTSTGLGLASISLAFAFGQLWWGLTQPFAGMAADRFGAGRVLVSGVLLVAIGTAMVPFMTTTGGLILAIGVLSAMGWAVGRWRMKSLLALVYAARAIAVLLFLLAPKTEAVLLVFAAVIGLTYLSTVPPTVGLVVKFFGPAHMGTLFGVVMLAHQIGGFMGAYLGGKAFEWTGSYDWMWYADIVLAIGAALIHLPIREAPMKAAAVAPAAA